MRIFHRDFVSLLLQFHMLADETVLSCYWQIIPVFLVFVNIWSGFFSKHSNSGRWA